MSARSPLVEVLGGEHLAKSFGATHALSDVSFSLKGPQVIGVLGPNGAGKTTLLEILEGLSSPTSGTARIFGAPLARKTYPRRRVGVVMQREFALDQITVGEYAELFAAIYAVKQGRSAILGRADLNAREGTPLDKLSGGEAQRLFLAAAVVHAPDLVFLDEPTAQLDPESKAKLDEDIRAMGRERTVVITTHDLREADAVCDYVLFLVDGRIKAEGARADLIAAVPEASRRGQGIEDAFFHFCAARLTAHGALESAR